MAFQGEGTSESKAGAHTETLGGSKPSSKPKKERLGQPSSSSVLSICAPSRLLCLRASSSPRPWAQITELLETQVPGGPPHPAVGVSVNVSDCAGFQRVLTAEQPASQHRF